MSGPPPPPRKRRPQQDIKDARLQHQQQQGEQPFKPNPFADQLYISLGITGPAETTIGRGVHVRGELSFERLVYIQGRFVGKLKSKGCVIVAPGGKVEGDMSDLGLLVVNGGHVKGNLHNLRNLVCVNSGKIEGNVCSKQFTCDKTSVIRGRVNIHPLAPEIIDVFGEVMVDIEVSNFSEQAL